MSLPNVRNEMGKQVDKTLNQPRELDETVQDEEQSVQSYYSDEERDQPEPSKSNKSKKRSRSQQPKVRPSKSKKRRKQRRERSPTDSSDFLTQSQHSSSNYEDEYDDLTL